MPPLPDITGTRIRAYDPVDDMMKVKSVQKKMRDSFTRPITDLWEVTTFGGSEGQRQLHLSQPD